VILFRFFVLFLFLVYKEKIDRKQVVLFCFQKLMEQAREVINWDQYFMNIANEVAKRSKDPSTQV